MLTRLPLDWAKIDTVLLDMDDTLLDLHFDNHFWQNHLPRRYAEARGVAVESVREELIARFHARAGTLDWYSVDYWATDLEIDIMQLKEEIAQLVAVHPHVVEFLSAARAAGKRLVLVTNAHHKSLTLKMARTGLHEYFDAIYTAHTFGLPKEDVNFWDRLRAFEPFDPASTLLVEDSLAVLDSARDYGIAHLVAVTRPDTRQPPKPTGTYAAIADFSALISL
jgi:HAD superfamily hydrolase (TIGR01509 family)